jgi:hypothetical protein
MTRRSARRVFAALLLTIGLVGAGVSPALSAESAKTKIKVKYQLAEPPVFDPATSTLMLHLVGTGHSNVLGPVTVDTHVTQHVREGCDPATAQHVFSTASGSLSLQGDDRVCPGDGRQDRYVFGVWDITGGTGDYHGAAGSGSLNAKIHDDGRVFAEFTGILTL